MAIDPHAYKTYDDIHIDDYMLYHNVYYSLMYFSYKPFGVVRGRLQADPSSFLAYRDGTLLDRNILFYVYPLGFYEGLRISYFPIKRKGMTLSL